ncbi:MAG: alpha-hydroxy-acid oxidizing protein [Actinomycetota bacterium]|nr:alpha-hydroxy-acid oxidizing protein [Actinomycetota bacterium]
MTRIVNLADFEPMARANMDPAAFDYYFGGAWDEITLRDNVSAFNRYRLRPRVLVDVSAVDMSVDLLGTHAAMPLGLAPTALQQLAAPEGEVATARAATSENALMCLSTISSRSLEDVAEVGGPRWMQLYVFSDRALSEELVKRAEVAGYSALVVTADLPVPGYRERDVRNEMPIPDDQALGNFAHIETEGELLPFIASLNDPSLTWEDLAWLRGLTSLPIVVKGILTAEDARLAVEHGAAAVMVSNHGGRQLDRVPASIDVLEEVVEAVDGRCEVYVDGGVRRGTDVLVARALGAKAVFIGRPYLWALAAMGEKGVRIALKILKTEIAVGMALLGTPRLSDITRAHVM